MKTKQPDKDTVAALRTRVRELEDIERFTIDALEMAASLGDFQSSINKSLDNAVILSEARQRICGLIPFEEVYFYLVDEDSQDFVLSGNHSHQRKAYIQEQVDKLIGNGTFAWALREKRPVTVHTADQKKQLILHVMTTSSRVRGMFAGILPQDCQSIPYICLAMLSIILLNSANALESFELYQTIRKINTNLERVDNYRLLFEAAPDGVELLDARGNIVDCNESQQKIVGHAYKELIGSHTSDFFSERSKTSFAEQFRQLMDNGYREEEVELVSAKGDVIPVWRKEKVIYDAGCLPVGVVIYNHDISAIRKAEEEKRDLEIRLQRAQKMEALGTLAGGVAHDLNNILSGLVSYPELLLMQIPADSPLRKSLVTIQKSGEKASAIVLDLLTLARRGIVHTKILNLNDIILEHLRTPEFEKLKTFHPHVSFTHDLDGKLANVMGSSVHLAKALMNLLSNAAEAMVDKGIVRISTGNRILDKPLKGFDTVQVGEYATLTVKDTGIGISPDNLERIFEPFYSKKIMGRSGTGLGMAVVWGTVKDHNGFIDVRSVENEGTTFTLFFPVTQEKKPKEKPRLAIEDYKGNRESILVVDDVEEQREIASVMLKKLNYNVETVASGEEAVEYVRNRPVDLVILDMIMDPNIDGLETYRRIIKFRPRQKAIITSGFSETDRVREAQRLGARTYVKKPYHLEKIGLAIRNELDGRKKE